MKSLIVENKAILCSLYCVVTLLFLVLTQQLNAAEVLLAPWQWSLLYFGIGFGVNAPKAVLFLLATEEWLELMQLCRSQKIKGAIANYFMSMEAGTLSGIIGLCAQLGASMSGYLLGIHILPVFGWKALCWMQILGAVMLIVLLVLVYLVEPTKHVKAE